MKATQRLTYSRYLHLEDLLAQHDPLCPPAHDEHLFITVHHVHELWFQQLLTELTDARDRMLTGEAHLPRLRLQRCHAIEQALLKTLHLLDTMAPRDFLAFRDGLGTASGAQSAQYHEIGTLSGRKDPEHIGRMDWLTPTEQTRLQRRMVEPSVWDGFLNVLTKAGYDTSNRESRDVALADINHDPAQGQLAELTEALIGHDQAWSQWRAHHLLIVERQIGGKPGTGGTTGAPRLRNGTTTRLFPELWEIRSKL